MIWQAAYAEYIFLKEYFPDFTPELLETCIQEYAARQRRFGS
jgi:undecaprenyl diphosphate synthase